MEQSNRTERQKEPLVSFVIPCYNKEPFITKAILSCVNQTLKDIEIIVVDDGSTDGTSEVINYLANKYPQIVYHKLHKNYGRSHARNVGNVLAKANIICVQDADDESMDKRAAITYDYFKNHSEIGIFYGSFYTCNFYGDITGIIKAKEFNYDNVVKTGYTEIGHGSMAYHKSIINSLKYDEKGKWAELGIDDWKLIMDMFHAGIKFGYTINPLYKYYQLSDSITGTRDNKKVKQAKEEYFKNHESIKTI